MNDSTLAKISANDRVIAISTYSRKCGRHGRFLILSERMDEWLDNGARGLFHDQDLDNVLTARSYDNLIRLDFKWLSTSSSGKISGWSQSFLLDKDDFMSAITCSNVVRLLSVAKPMGTVTFSGSAMKTIGKMDGKTRRAFAKAMRRDAIRWPETRTEVFADGNNDFFFRTDDGMCGGLILHHGSRNSVSYGVHT